MNNRENTKPSTIFAFDTDRNPCWDAETHAERIDALIGVCRCLARGPDIDGERTAALMAEEIFTACRAGVPQACHLMADWLHGAALDAVREFGKENDLAVWEQAGRPLDVGPFLP